MNAGQGSQDPIILTTDRYRTQMINKKAGEFIYHRHANLPQSTGEPMNIKWKYIIVNFWQA